MQLKRDTAQEALANRSATLVRLVYVYLYRLKLSGPGVYGGALNVTGLVYFLAITRSRASVLVGDAWKPACDDGFLQ